MDLIPQIGLVVWTSLVFITLLIILRIFAWKPILAALEERENSIESALKAADTARAELEKLTASNEKLLQEARVERDKIIAEAQITGKQLIEDAKEAARTEGEVERKKAILAIEAEKKAAVAEVKNIATSLSLEIAEKILRKELADKSSQEALIADYLKDASVSSN